MHYNKKLCSKDAGYAALVRISEAVDKIVETIKEDKRVIGWEEVVRSGPVLIGIEVLTDTIFQEMKWMEEEARKKGKK